MFSNEKIRYILTGSWNTLFGYSLVVIFYELLSDSLSTFTISIVSSIIAILQSFVAYKIFVFKTKGNWFKELLKSYLVYGVATVISAIFLTILVDYLLFSIYTSQLIVIGIVVIGSYYGHKFFTFK